MSPITITLQVEAVQAEAAANLTASLQSEIRELPIYSVKASRNGAAPEGARSGDAFTWSTLTVILGTPVLKQLLELLQAWLTRQKQQAKIQIKHDGAELIIEGKPEDEQLAAIQGFFRAISSKRSN